MGRNCRIQRNGRDCQRHIPGARDRRILELAGVLVALGAGCAAPPGDAASPAGAGLQQLSGHVAPAVAAAPRIGKVPAAERLSLVVGLPVRNPSELARAVEQVSDPTSPAYRHYLAPDEFAARHGASPGDYQQLLDWAHSHRLTAVAHPNRLAAEVTGTVEDLEAALHVRLEYALRPDGSQFHAPDGEPSLDLAVPVAHISNLDNYVRPRHATGGSGPGGARTGNDFRHAYASCTSLDGTGQAIGIFMPDSFRQSDITTYFTSKGLTAPLTVQAVPAGSGAGPAEVEATLDVEMALSMAPRAQVVAFTGSTNAILANMAQRPDIKQFSSSWFVYDFDSTTAALLAQLAMQGQSFFQASGDGGAELPGYFPDASGFRQHPNVTSVGGTRLDMNGAGASYGSEVTWSASTGMILSFSGGGGVPIPLYQVGLANSANHASAVYRNIPDVSAEAENVGIVLDSSSFTTGGTSAAAPLWAGFMALVNQRAQANRAPSIGFANPALYALARTSYATSFNDITAGAAPNQGTAPPSITYAAVTGYDLATGLGSPRCGLIDGLAGFYRTRYRTNDRDARGVSDVMVVRPSAAQVWISSNKIDGTPDFWWGAFDQAAALPSSVIISGDVDGDRQADLIARSGSTIWVAYGREAYHTWHPGSIAGSDLPSAGDEVLIGDFDGDGRGDLMRRHRNDSINRGEWRFHHGRGDGSFDAAQLPFPGGTAYVANVTWTVGDLNGDGLSDLLVRYRGTGQFWVSFNMTPPAPGVAPTFYGGVNPTIGGSIFAYADGDRLIAMDVDQDGRDDIVVARPVAGAAQLQWWVSTNQGGNGFGAGLGMLINGSSSAYLPSDVVLGALP